MHAFPVNPWAWGRKLEGGADLTYLAPATILLNAQITFLVKLPSSVPASEARAILPLPDRGELDDRLCILQTHELVSMQACRLAAALEDHPLAAQHAKATLRRTHNPVKYYFAHRRLGGLRAVKKQWVADADG